MFDFKGFIHSLLRREEPGAVTNLKSATQFMKDLDVEDYVRAQTEVTRTLAELNRNGHIGVRERMRTVLYLDEKAQILQLQLRSDWLNSLEAAPSVSRQLQPTLIAYWQQQQLAFKACIRGYAKSPSRALEDGIMLVVARALASYVNEAVSSLVRYLPIEDRIWRNLHRLYLFAENEGFAEDRIQLYPDQPELVSCLHLYLRLAMIHLAQPDRLSIHQILRLEQWLQRPVEALELEAQIRPHRQVFVVNVGTETPPRRLRRTMIGETYRYWTTDGLLARLEQDLGRLKDGANPVEIGFGEGIRTQECVQLLSGLIQRWAREADPMLRKHERESLQKSITVAQGVRDVIQHLKVGLPKSAAAKTMDYRVTGPATVSPQMGGDALFESHLEEWLVENQSLTGVGASFNPSHQNELRVGTLVGLRAEGDKRCAVGIVRRLQNSPEGQGYAGIETLSQTPLVVELGEADGDERFEAIYLPEIADAKQPRSLIIPAACYRPERSLRLAAQGKAYLIRLMPAVEDTRDFVRANFQVVGKG